MGGGRFPAFFWARGEGAQNWVRYVGVAGAGDGALQTAIRRLPELGFRGDQSPSEYTHPSLTNQSRGMDGSGVLRKRWAGIPCPGAEGGPGISGGAW